MKHRNIAIFVPHAGCPHACAFCNQKTITAQQESPCAADVRRICMQALAEISDRRNTEIAFFGGSFTAIARDYMTELLDAVQPFLGADGFSGIRISTRPDYIDREVLDLLRSCGVTAIELGAQSMCDHVLAANDRGHTAQDVVNACGLIREFGFELGLQVMLGLYKSSWDDEWHTMEQVISLHPDTVRIYPVVILKGTRLARLYEAGIYEPFPTSENVEDYPTELEDMIDCTAAMMEEYLNAGIRIIKVGLHASEFVEQDMIGGYYHPAFRELCESRIYRSRMEHLHNERAGLTERVPYSEETWRQISEKLKMPCTFAVHPSCISKAIGHKRANILYFQKMGTAVKIIGDENLDEYEIKLRE